LLATFPVVAADQFGSAPLLIRSSPGFRTLAIAAEGTCRPGDRFVLATDAVAVRLFKSSAVGPGPQWKRFETIAQADWRAELNTLRSANDMVNDDCTLVVLRVSGGNEEVEWTTEPEVEEIQETIEEQAPPPLRTEALRESAATSPQPEEVLVAEKSESDSRREGAEPEQRDAKAAEGELDSASEQEQPSTASTASEPPESPTEQPPEPLAPMEDFVITPDVADLMIDLSHDSPADQPARPHDAAEQTKQPVEPPVDDPPATRDGFPDSTDPSV
jgi:hypothetical protein